VKKQSIDRVITSHPDYNNVLPSAVTCQLLTDDKIQKHVDVLRKISPEYLSKLVQEKADAPATQKVEAPATVKDNAAKFNEVTAYQGEIIKSFLAQNNQKVCQIFLGVSTVPNAKEKMGVQVATALSELREKDRAHLEVLAAMCMSLFKQAMGRAVGDEDALKLAVKALLLPGVAAQTDAVEKISPEYIQQLMIVDMDTVTKTAEHRMGAM